MVDTARG